MEIEKFFQTHVYLIEHTHVPVRRALMDTIDWSYRMIGIKGPRGVGKTTFLLQYAKENFDVRLRQCLYINMNSFYFQGRGIVSFAGEFVEIGGQVLLIDQAFKLPNWKEQLCECYRRNPRLRIVYTTSSVEEGDGPDDSELSQLSRCYVLHGFSFREFINLQTGNNFRPYTMNEVLHNHDVILKSILPKVKPWEYFRDYLHHGYYPFFLENRNFTENLLKAMNMMIEVDILFIKQIELKYLSRIKKLLYLLAKEGGTAPNVSRLAEDIVTSRATVMNYLRNLEQARLINMVYREGDSYPKKPALVMLHDTNLMYAVYASGIAEQQVMETFFVNSLWRHHQVNKTRRDGVYRIDQTIEICVCDRPKRFKSSPDMICANYNTEVGQGNQMPLWLFGFLY